MRSKNNQGSIWFIHPYSVPPEYPASTRHYYLGTELANRGWNVCLWQSAFIHPLKQYYQGCAGKILVKEQRGSLQLYWLWGLPYKSNNWRRSFNMLIWSFLIIPVSLLQRKPQVILGSSPHIFAALAGLLVSKIFRIPFVLEVRDLWPDTLKDMGALSQGLLSKLLYILEKWIYRESSKIIVLTEGIGQRIKDKGVKSSKIVFVPNGIYLNATKDAKPPIKAEEVKKSLGLDGKFICTYTGAHGPANALDVIVNAAHFLKDEQDIAFLLIGEGQEKLRLMEKVKKSGLCNVVFHDPVPRSHVNVYIKASDLCILTLKDIPVFNTALPNKLFDYMYENKPILCALGGEAANLVRKEQLGIAISPENPREMADSILRLKNNNDLLKSYGVNGRLLIEEKYTFEKLSKDVESILVRIIKPN